MLNIHTSLFEIQKKKKKKNRLQIKYVSPFFKTKLRSFNTHVIHHQLKNMQLKIAQNDALK